VAKAKIGQPSMVPGESYRTFDYKRRNVATARLPGTPLRDGNTLTMLPEKSFYTENPEAFLAYHEVFNISCATARTCV